MAKKASECPTGTYEDCTTCFSGNCGCNSWMENGILRSQCWDKE